MVNKSEISGSKISFKNILSRKQLIAILIFFIAILSVLYYIFFTSNYYEMDEPVKFDIKRGETLSQVINRLYDEKIIPNKTNMRIAAFVYGAEKKIRAARYYIPNGLSYLDLLDLFMYGEADYIRRVSLREGLSIPYLASRLKREALIDSAAFVQITNDTGFAASFNITAPTLEGYLFPDVYYIYQRSPAEEVINILVEGFNNFMHDTLKHRAAELGLTVHEVVVLASIVKGETHNFEEMPRIAGVYLNRLKIGMKLQADPTLQYILPGGWRRLLYEDLKVDSPYNTYLYSGLPPGAINSPGRNSILSVLYPEQHDYLFFVADGRGGHNFSRTYAEHLRYVREYRQWVNSQKKNR